MDRISILLLMIMFQGTLLYGQNFLVVDANKAFSSTGEELNNCNFLSITDTIEVRPNGHLRLIHQLGHSLELTATGRYPISAYTNANLQQDTLVVLDLSAVCDEKAGHSIYTGAVKAGMTEYPLVTTVGPTRIRVLHDTITLHWTYLACNDEKFKLPCRNEEHLKAPKAYQLIVKNIFDEELLRIATADTSMELIWKPEWEDESILVIQFEIEGRRIYDGESVLIRLNQAKQAQVSKTLVKLNQGTVTSQLAQVFFLKQKKLHADALQILKLLIKNNTGFEKWYSRYYQELLTLAYQKL